jgi:catechol 2,3-dioxygenase-like lactoylglutathione lyase family enzyme
VAVTAKPVLEFAHAVVYVCDMDRMIAFYRDVLGFEVSDRGPLGRSGGEREIVFLSQSCSHHHQIAFIDGRTEPGPSNNVDHLAFRAAGSLQDLRSLRDALQADDAVSEITPLTHGNAWSVYFRDPEGNRVEVFIDTPWHVAQPQGRRLDLDRSDEEIQAWTVEEFGAEPEFGPISEYYERRRLELDSAG